MNVRTLAQLSAIALCWGAAYLDLQRPGYLQFHDPIPWQAIDQLRGNWGECPEIQSAVTVPGIGTVSRFFSYPTSLNHWKTRLGDPLCHVAEAEGDRAEYIWIVPNQTNLYIRISFDAQGKAIAYEFLHSQASPRDRESESGSPVPAVGAEQTSI